MPLSHRDYTVACICPMEVELAPVTALLDQTHPGLPTQRDQNSYVLGEIGRHNLVIAVLPEIGTNAAATVAIQLLNDFPSIRFGLLVGIGGGVPDIGNEIDIRLGDIVVSKPTKTAGGVVQYDLGKETFKGFLRIGTLDKPPLILRAAVQQLAARHELEDSHVPGFIAQMLDKFPKMKEKYSHPGAEQDQLFETSYDHQGGETCVSCDHSQVLSRPPRSTSNPVIHYGTIGSANRVIKNAGEREKLKSSDLDIICVEMEAAGLMDSFPCLVIRGICDYADSHKNKKWQPYAAATAAAYMKELLSIIPMKDIVKASPATDVVQIPITIVRVPDLIRDSKLSVQFFPEYVEHIHFLSNRRARRQQRIEQWSRVKSLGRGVSGTVWLENCLTVPGKLRAVKEITKLSPSTGPLEYSRELEAIAKFSQQKYNGCFVQSFGWYENAEAVFVTLEYFPYGDLQKYITKPLPEREAQQITYQVLEGVRFMHENEYAHRDLKPANILVASESPSWWVKIGDFGISKRAEEGVTVLRTVSGTPGFLAPELLGFIDFGSGSDFSYTTAVDIWAVGEIAFRLLSGGESPFQNLNCLRRFVEGRLSFPSDELFAHGVSQEAYSFTENLMTAIPEHRPSAENALEFDWLKSQRDFEIEGSPEWFVKKIVDDTITSKQLQSLGVSLRTQPISWVKTFVEIRGQIALTNVLIKINGRGTNRPVLTGTSVSSENDSDRECDIVKCLKGFMNNKYGADEALTSQEVPIALATCLISPLITTRKLASELLTFLCYNAESLGHIKILQAMDHVKSLINENGRFDAWMRTVEATIDGHGKMGSLLLASQEVRHGGIGIEELYMGYAVATLVLINTMVDVPERDLQLRCHIRAQFIACGIKRILKKMEGWQYEVIYKQIEIFHENEAIDEDIFTVG